MDSSVLLAGIGVLGTLGGAVVGGVIGAWLNPLTKAHKSIYPHL